MEDIWAKDNKIRKAVGLAANIALLLLAIYLFLDTEGFKRSQDCKAYQPIIDIMKQCNYGVRGDLCYTPLGPLPNYSIYPTVVINGVVLNETRP